MQKPNDERLIAYLDGELAEGERAEIALWLERDEALRERAAELTESAALLRSALDEVLREPVPERLITAARGETTSAVTDLAAARATRARRFGDRRWWIGLAASASIFGITVGSGIGYLVGEPSAPAEQVAAGWLDNAAVYHNLYVNAGADDHLGFDVAAGQKLPQNFRLPNLKPWGLDFQGVRYLIIEGRPATQLPVGARHPTRHRRQVHRGDHLVAALGRVIDAVILVEAGGRNPSAARGALQGYFGHQRQRHRGAVRG